jgi:hypothetical protein
MIAGLLASGFFWSQTKDLDGLAKVKLGSSFSLHSEGYGIPQVKVEANRATFTLEVYRGYRFVKGKIDERGILRGGTFVYPVILDITIFNPAASLEELTKMQNCFSTDLWGMGNCGEMGSTYQLTTRARLVLEDGSIRVFEPGEPLSYHWNDAGRGAQRPFGFTAIDFRKKIRLDLYCSHNRFTRDEAKKFIIDAIASAEVFPDKVSAAFAETEKKLEIEKRLYQAELDAIDASIRPLGLDLSKGHYQTANGVVFSLDHQGTIMRDIVLAAPIGEVIYPAGTAFSRWHDPPKLKLLPARGVMNDNPGFSAWYWDSRQGRELWERLDLNPPDKDGLSQQFHLPDDLVRSWKSLNIVHIYRKFELRLDPDLRNDNPALIRDKISEFVQSIPLLRKEMQNRRLIVKDE